jgi:superfamily II DNA or RNA helicase
VKVIVGEWAWLPKAELSDQQILTLRRALTIYPKKIGDHPGEAPEPIFLYEDKDNGLFGIPREYFLANKKPNHEIEYRLTEGDKSTWPGPLTFQGKLREEQERAISTWMERTRDDRLGGLIRATAGAGKTVLACGLISRLQVPTLVVVHKKFLLRQWEERIAQFLPDAKVGRAQQDVCDYEGKHVVIGMVHSLGSREYPRAFLDWPGLIIVDEVHRIGAATWAPVPARFPARYRLGLSATPRRKDGADNVFLYQIGEVLYASAEQRMAPKIRRVPTDFHLIKTDRFNANLAPKSLKITFLVGSKPRNKLIRDRLVLALQAGRKVLVLSERLKHLHELEADLRSTWPVASGPTPSTDFYVGGRSEDDLDVAAEARCIFATSQFAAEGLDIPSLDTLFLTTPISDVEQAAGRILRPYEGKKDPIIVDFRDDAVTQFKKSGEARDRYYAKFS